MRAQVHGWWIALALALTALSPAAQQRPVNPSQLPPPPPAARTPVPAVLHSVVNLVLIDVQVTDHNGKPVKGLKPEQFTVLEEGKPQKITSFQYYDIEAMETATAPDSKPVVVPLGIVAPSAKVSQEVQSHRLIVLFFDLTAMEPPELLRARDAAARYLRQQMTPADLVSVVAFGNRLNILTNFTNDRARLARAVDNLRPGKESGLAAMAEAGATAGEVDVTEDTGAAYTPDETEFNIFNTDRKLAALESLSNLLRGIPGKKSVVQFTGGITQTGDENRTQLRATTDAANRADVSFYTVDARGLLATVPGGEASKDAPGGTSMVVGGRASRLSVSGRSMFNGTAVFQGVATRNGSRETLATLAIDTGGRAFFDLGDFSDVFRKVQSDAPGYYLLGYSSTNAKWDGRWRAVKVRVATPGLRVRARDGYYAPRSDRLLTTEDRERQLEDAMRSDSPRVEFPVALEIDAFRLNDNEYFVPITAKLDSSALEWAKKRGRHETELDFAAEVRDARSGRAVAALRDTMKVSLGADRFSQLQRALLYQGGVVLGPGNYRLKFIARENETGRISTFEEDLALAPRQRTPLELSSVLLSSQLEPIKKSSEVKKTSLGEDAKLKTTPLEVSGERIVPSVTRVFTTQQQLYVFFQAYLSEKADGSKLRAGLVLFRDGEWASEAPLAGPIEVDQKMGTATFRIGLPLDKLGPGRYTVQAVVVDGAGELGAFGRSYFALRVPPDTPAMAPERR
jgi:VWFA-related protein